MGHLLVTVTDARANLPFRSDDVVRCNTSIMPSTVIHVASNIWTSITMGKIDFAVRSTKVKKKNGKTFVVRFPRKCAPCGFGAQQRKLTNNKKTLPPTSTTGQPLHLSPPTSLSTAAATTTTPVAAATTCTGRGR
jgi:predicted Zn-ribbon and HTH transcriptional regulator